MGTTHLSFPDLEQHFAPNFSEVGLVVIFHRTGDAWIRVAERPVGP